MYWKHREKMGGANLRFGCMEVAFEQWTERVSLVGFTGISHRYKGSGIDGFVPACWQSVDLF